VIDLFKLGYKMFYWRTADQREIDFVLYGEAGLVAIEVKRSRKVGGRDVKALQAFLADYPGARAFCFYGGSERVYRGAVQVIPIAEAILQLPSLLKV
jgi:predicted AAA+ superfamily ATPase